MCVGSTSRGMGWRSEGSAPLLDADPDFPLVRAVKSSEDVSIASPWVADLGVTFILPDEQVCRGAESVCVWGATVLVCVCGISRGFEMCMDSTIFEIFVLSSSVGVSCGRSMPCFEKEGEGTSRILRLSTMPQ